MRIKQLRIFVASPSDVELERQVTLQVIHRLGLRYRNHVQLKPILWERQPLLASGHFQDALDPGTADIMVCVLWSRLGSPLPPDFKGPDGETPITGTEWEFQHARAAYANTGKPSIIVYRKTNPPNVNPEELDLARQQLNDSEAVGKFFDSHFYNIDDAKTIKRAYFPFESTEQFEQQLETHLAELVEQQLDVNTTDELHAVTWHSGSPFRGLSAFELEHRDIFFGRTQAVGEAIAQLKEQVAREQPFLMILGMSGGGKTSLVNAGLLPLILTPRVIQNNVGLVRHVGTRPGQWSKAATPLQGITNALLQALPELVDVGQNAETLEELVLASPKSLRAVFDTAISQARAKENLHWAVTVRVLLVLDQSEELFTNRRFSSAQLKQLSQALQRLIDTGLIWILGSIRSDFLVSCEQTPELADLMRHGGQYLLLPPRDAELEQIIRQPAIAAGLAYELDKTTGLGLDAVLKEAVSLQPGALPLLEFTLDELFISQDTESRQLTYSAYKAIGGLEGAIGQRADAVCNKLKHQIDLDRALATVLRALITISLDEQDTPTARHIPRDHFADDQDATLLVNALLDARLLIVEGGIGEPQLRVAHEALNREWKRARDWKDNDIEFLRWNAQAEHEAKLWEDEGKPNARLLRKGKPLVQAEGWVETRPTDITQDIRLFIAASSRLVYQRKTRVWAIVSAVGVLLLLLTAGAVWQAIEANGAKILAQGEVNKALETNSLYLASEARKESEKGFHDRAILLALNGLPFMYGGEQRPEVPALRTALAFVTSHDYKKIAQFQHANMVVLAKFSPDGNRVVTASGDDTAALWDVSSGVRLAVFQHGGDVRSAQFNLNGSRIVTASGDNTAALWDVSSGGRLVVFQHEDDVRFAQFSPDGTRIATASSNGSATLWDVSSGSRLAVYQHQASVRYVQFSPDGTRLATASFDNTAALWDVSSGKRLAVYQHDDDVHSAHFSPDGTRVATTSADYTAVLWDVASGVRLAVFQHENAVRFAQFSPDGAQVVTASEDNTAGLWDVASGERLAVFRHENGVLSSHFSPDGTRVVTASYDGTAVLWDAASGARLADFRHENTVFTAQFSPDGTRVATASWDKTAALWNVSGGVRQAVFQHEDGVRMAGVSPDNNRVLTASTDGTAALWDVASGSRLAVFEHENTVFTAQFSPDGTQVLTAAWDDTAALWDVASGARLAVFQHEASVFSAQLSPDGTQVLTAAWDDTAALWDVASGARLAVYQHEAEVVSARFSPDGTQVVTASYDGTATLWDVASGVRLAIFEHDANVHSARFSADGTQVVTTSEDKTAAVWDVVSAKRLAVFQHEASVGSAQFSPDASRVATASWDGTAGLWDIASGERLAVFRHEAEVLSAQFNPDGTQLVTASWDNTAALWDVASGARLYFFHHENPVLFARFSPDGSRVVTASNDYTAALWDETAARRDVLRQYTLADIVEQYLPKNRTCLTPEERERFFLPELTDKQWIHRGCPQFAAAKND